jgi:shikimate kinase
MSHLERGEPRHLVLIGMMGVGKSSVGRSLASRLGRPFVDVDRLVEKRAGKTVAEIFAADGEPAFRALESETVREVLDSGVWAVVAFGGGAVLDPANRRVARETALVVWLQAPAEELARRVMSSQRRSGAARPLLASDEPAETVLDGLARQREEAYRATAHVVVDTAGRTPGQVARAVLAATGWDAGSR